MDEQLQQSFTKGRKWAVGFNVAVATLSALALVVMVNYLAARYPVRLQVSAAASQKISPMTTRVLNSLTNKVKVTVFFDRREPLFSSVANLIKEYQIRSPRLEVEFVDYRYPGRAELVRAQYKLTASAEGSRVIFDCDGRVRSVLASELSDYDWSSGREIRRSAFKGEQLFTSAILTVTVPRRLRAYFLTGHGEHDPASEDDQSGYSRFAKMLVDGNIEVGPLAPLHTVDVPEDCSLLVIAGAVRPFAREELERIDRYLAQGGRLLALFNYFDPRAPRTGLEGLLANWGIEIGYNQVKDNPRAKASEAMVLVASQFGAHPIAKPLLRSSLNFVLPRSAGARMAGAPRADAPKAVELVFTGPEGVAIGNIDARGTGEIERSGAVPLAVAAEKGGLQGVATDRGASRLVVVGSSLCLANAPFVSAANADFANLAVNWLLNRDILLGDIAPRAVSEYQLTVTEQQMSRLRWFFLAGAPGFVLAVGIVVWMRRRS